MPVPKQEWHGMTAKIILHGWQGKDLAVLSFHSRLVPLRPLHIVQVVVRLQSLQLLLGPSERRGLCKPEAHYLSDSLRLLEQ
jgi:hypothetical protein